MRPERVDDFESGVTWGSRSARLTANAFAMLFRDEIAPTGEISASTGDPLYENVDRSSRIGLELDGTWQAHRNVELHGDLSVMRARLERYTEPYSGTEYRDVRPMLTPAVTSTHGATIGLGAATRLMVDGRFVGASALTNTGEASLELPSRYSIDTGVEVAHRFGSLSLGIRNATDTRAYGSGYAYDGVRYFYVEAPRSFYVTAALKL
mgnify:CR=1 FL=1